MGWSRGLIAWAGRVGWSRGLVAWAGRSQGLVKHDVHFVGGMCSLPSVCLRRTLRLSMRGRSSGTRTSSLLAFRAPSPAALRPCSAAVRSFNFDFEKGETTKEGLTRCVFEEVRGAPVQYVWCSPLASVHANAHAHADVRR
jgi:hypothetical protein